MALLDSFDVNISTSDKTTNIYCTALYIYFTKIQYLKNNVTFGSMLLLWERVIWFIQIKSSPMVYVFLDHTKELLNIVFWLIQ